MMTVYKILFTLILIPLVVYGQSSRYAAAYMELGVGPRALGMGSAYVAQSGDVPGVHWNPAGLAFLPSLQASSMYATVFNQLEKQSYVGAAIPVFGGASVAVSWTRVSVEDIPKYAFDDELTALDRVFRGATRLTSAPEGYFNNNNDALIVTFAKYVQWKMDLGWQYFEVPVDFGFGLNLKLLNQTIDDKSGSGMGMDAGMITRLGLNEIFSDSNYGDLAFGLSVQDFTSTRITWDTDSKHKDRIAYNIKYGFSYLQPLQFASSALTVAVDFNTRYTGSAHAGAEFLYHSLFAVRAGMNSGYFTAGAGLYLWKFHLDYAYQGHALGNSHRVALTFGL